MKQLIGVLVLVAFVAVSSSEASFTGFLKPEDSWAVKVTTQGANAGSTAVQVVGLKKKQLVVLGTMIVPPNGEGVLTFKKVPGGINRVIIEVDPPTGGGAVVKVVQGLTEFDLPIVGDARFVFEVASEP